MGVAGKGILIWLDMEKAFGLWQEHGKNIGMSEIPGHVSWPTSQYYMGWSFGYTMKSWVWSSVQYREAFTKNC